MQGRLRFSTFFSKGRSSFRFFSFLRGEKFLLINSRDREGVKERSPVGLHFSLLCIRLVNVSDSHGTQDLSVKTKAIRWPNKANDAASASQVQSVVAVSKERTTTSKPLSNREFNSSFLA